MSNWRVWLCLSVLIVLLSACSTGTPVSCPEATPIGLGNADAIASDDSLPFRFPLDQSPIDEKLYFGWFGVSNECPPGKQDCYVYPERLFHAAEDYKRPAGTAVYAMADGVLSYSGKAGGYGWLILIDHPQANLYSLYGHLSPSRWALKNGSHVQRGDLIGYLGDSWENGGSREQPVETHLHFGIRTGQTTDYPARGEWRYHGGWLKVCPQDVGWLQPSLIITEQDIPVGGFPKPDIPFLTRWGLELLFPIAYAAGGLVMLIDLAKNKKRLLLPLPGFIGILAGIVFRINGFVRSYMVLGIGALILFAGVALYFRRNASQTA